MRDRLIYFGSASLVLLLLYLLAGAIPVDHEQPDVVFRTPAFLAVSLAAGFLMLKACFLRRPAFRQAAFVLAHAGGAAIVAGALIGWTAGRRIEGVRLPVSPGHAIQTLRGEDGTETDLGFALSITNFTAAYYEPVYSLYQPTSAQPHLESDYRFVRKVDPRSPSSLSALPAGPVTPAQLQEGTEWKMSLFLTNGWVLQREPPVPRRLDAEVRVTRREGTETRLLAVNHPLTENGWRVQLVSYSREPMPFVELAFRRDPGRPWVVGGIWAVILGVALLCLQRPRPEEKEATDDHA